MTVSASRVPGPYDKASSLALRRLRSGADCSEGYTGEMPVRFTRRVAYWNDREPSDLAYLFSGAVTVLDTSGDAAYCLIVSSLATSGGTPIELARIPLLYVGPINCTIDADHIPSDATHLTCGVLANGSPRRVDYHLAVAPLSYGVRHK